MAQELFSCGFCVLSAQGGQMCLCTRDSRLRLGAGQDVHLAVMEC